MIMLLKNRGICFFMKMNTSRGLPARVNVNARTMEGFDVGGLDIPIHR